MKRHLASRRIEKQRYFTMLSRSPGIEQQISHRWAILVSNEVLTGITSVFGKSNYYWLLA